MIQPSLVVQGQPLQRIGVIATARSSLSPVFGKGFDRHWGRESVPSDYCRLESPGLAYMLLMYDLDSVLVNAYYSSCQPYELTGILRAAQTYREMPLASSFPNGQVGLGR